MVPRVCCTPHGDEDTTDLYTDSGLATLDHDHHRLRRTPLNQFFSIKSVRDLQPVIEERVDQLLSRLEQEGQKNFKVPTDILYPFSAFTNGTLPERRQI